MGCWRRRGARQQEALWKEKRRLRGGVSWASSAQILSSNTHTKRGWLHVGRQVCVEAALQAASSCLS